MNQIIYEELRNRVRETTHEENRGELYFKTVNYIRIAADMARREGLLAIDPDPEYGMINQFIPADDSFLHILSLIVNGTDAAFIMDIVLTRYYADDLKGTEAILALMRLVGGLAIQAGDNQMILCEKLESMIPRKFFAEYNAIKTREDAKNAKTQAEKLEETMQKLCERDTIYLEENRMNLAGVLCDRMLEQITNQDMSRILREVDNVDLTFALKQMSGMATKKIFDNLSERLAHMIVDDMEHMGPARLEDVEKAKSKILAVMIRLLKQNKLNPEHFELLTNIMEGGQDE